MGVFRNVKYSLGNSRGMLATEGIHIIMKRLLLKLQICEERENLDDSDYILSVNEKLCRKNE